MTVRVAFAVGILVGVAVAWVLLIVGAVITFADSEALDDDSLDR